MMDHYEQFTFEKEQIGNISNYVKEGEVVRVNTDTGEYVERVNQ